MEAEARAFAESYASQWTPPTTAADAENLGKLIASFYRPTMTFFIHGKVIRLNTAEDVTSLFTSEIVGAFSHGIAAKAALALRDCDVQVIGQGAAICRIRFDFHPAEGRGNAFEFTNWYGYRAAGDGVKAGWEFVVRDQEIEGMGRVMGAGN